VVKQKTGSMHLGFRLPDESTFLAMQLMIQMADDQTFVTGIDQPVQ